jgi:hypothetical protein
MKIMDFKKEYKDLYLPKETPVQIEVPAMTFLMVDGKGNPNTEGGEYQTAVELLYGLSYAIKMSPKSGVAPEGYVDYVVPPLEGMWWMKDEQDMDFTQKDKYYWTSMIRQPDFVTQEVLARACEVVLKKKPSADLRKARLVVFTEGLCVQCMHIGPYGDEPRTVAKIEEYVKEAGLTEDIGTRLPDGMIRRHHEIYLSDPRKSKPEAMKTILRHPVRNV